ncbi:hypothetical protein RB595_007853 [Gaeumannomyces hyphopodioides]
MASPSILIIGATGHIGSSVLAGLKELNLDARVAALARTEKDFQVISDIYPGVRCVLGSMEDLSTLEQESLKADIIINTSPDMPYEAGIRAILAALARPRAPPRETFYIHTSGAANIWTEPTGQPSDRVWDDVADLEELSSFPDTVTHSATDRLVAQQQVKPTTDGKFTGDGGAGNTLRTAIIAPPDVFGLAPSAKRRTPLVLGYVVDVARRVGGAFRVGPGENILALVDVRHLARLYAGLVKNALWRLERVSKGAAVDGVVDASSGLEMWGPRAYYFIETRELTWREFLGDMVVPTLKKHGDEAFAAWDQGQFKVVSLEEIKSHIMARFGDMEGAEVWSGHVAENMAVTMRTRGSRTAALFGLRPEDALLDIERDVKALLGVI